MRVPHHFPTAVYLVLNAHVHWRARIRPPRIPQETALHHHIPADSLSNNYAGSDNRGRCCQWSSSSSPRRCCEEARKPSRRKRRCTGFSARLKRSSYVALLSSRVQTAAARTTELHSAQHWLGIPRISVFPGSGELARSWGPQSFCPCQNGIHLRCRY